MRLSLDFYLFIYFVARGEDGSFIQSEIALEETYGSNSKSTVSSLIRILNRMLTLTVDLFMFMEQTYEANVLSGKVMVVLKRSKIWCTDKMF